MSMIPEHVPAALVRDFNLEFHGPVDDLFPRMDALRDQGRLLWIQGGLSGSASGAWMFTEAQDIRAALQQPDLFSSQLGADSGLPTMIPIFMDPPEHTQYRRLLNPLFAPGVVNRMEVDIQRRIHLIVEDLVDRNSCDFVADVAIQFPTRVFTSWIGLPEDETGKFVSLVRALMHGADGENTRDAAMGNVFIVLNQLISHRIGHPADDLISEIIALDLDGRPLSTDELFRIAFLLFLAGLDTVAAALSFAFWHLAQTPPARRAITTGDIPVAQAAEELLRRHSFVNLPRVVARDTEFDGVTLKRGDPVVLALAMASRDPQEYHDASNVDFGRDGNRHYAFGVGPHRCLGSHLARLEMQLALEEWHARIPDYSLDGDVESYAGTVMGVTSLPLRWA
jgi:cytochrome P450